MERAITKVTKIPIHCETKPKKSQRCRLWKNQEVVLQFLSKIKEKYNLNSPGDWNSITQKHIKFNGGGTLLKKYSMFELKCMGCPEGKSTFNNPPQSAGYWEKQKNVVQFLSKIKEKYNLNSPEDWNSITTNHIISNGGRTLLAKYSLFKLKYMACPEGISEFTIPPHSAGYWENKENILNFLSEIKQKYNLHTPEDWNSISTTQFKINGGGTLLKNYSMFDLKCMACPEGKSIFNNPYQSPGYWENQENVYNFLLEIKEKYKFNTKQDWNLFSQKHIQSNGGGTLLNKYSMFELKCLACPEGKDFFTKSNETGYWEKKENIHKFLSEIKEKYNLNTPEDWNSITRNLITSNGGSTLLNIYSMFEIKCLACPEGKSMFNAKQSSRFWDDKKNILTFLSKLKQKYNLNFPEDWNLITVNHIKLNGGASLLRKHSVFELKCMACPEGKATFNNPYQSSEFWEIEENIHNFLEEIKEKYNLNTPQDWKRISRHQIISAGGSGLFNKKNYLDIEIKFETPNEPIKSVPLSKLISGHNAHKRSSQRWLFLQVQKLFPHEEIVEDYFHSEISRISGFNVQFDIFMIERKIAIEYHGKQHYEDIPSAFSNLETYQQRDTEKENLCSEHGIQLIVIPYWWNNKLDSLKTYLYSKINP